MVADISIFSWIEILIFHWLHILDFQMLSTEIRNAAILLICGLGIGCTCVRVFLLISQGSFSESLFDYGHILYYVPCPNMYIVEFFLNNTNLTFLYKIVITEFQNQQKKIASTG